MSSASETSRARPRITERQWALAQAISGLLFATFLLVHLTNTLLATFGQGTYDGYLRAVRHYYQAPGIEIVLIVLAPSVHMIAGLVRAYRRRQKAKADRARAQKKPAPWRLRLHRASGVVLLIVFFGHVAATRGPGLFFDAPADFAFLTFSLEHYPFYFYPYYALFAASGLYHLVHGTIAALALLRVRIPRAALDVRSRAFFALVAVGVLAVWLGIASLGGHLFEVDRDRYEEIQGIWDRFLPT